MSITYQTRFRDRSCVYLEKFYDLVRSLSELVYNYKIFGLLDDQDVEQLLVELTQHPIPTSSPL